MSSPYWAAPLPTAPRSAHPASPAPPASTAASSTGTATCSTRSTPWRPAPPAAGDTPGPTVTRASLQADLLAARERAHRLTAASTNWRSACPKRSAKRPGSESGLGAPADIDAVNQNINHLEQQDIDLRLQLEERDQDLAAARAANRELMAQLNTATRHR